MKNGLVGFVRTPSALVPGKHTRTMQTLKTVMWWQSPTNYNPPQRKLSLRHLAIVGGRKTVCGVAIPAVTFLTPRVEEFGEGCSDCKRCKAASS